MSEEIKPILIKQCENGTWRFGCPWCKRNLAMRFSKCHYCRKKIDAKQGEIYKGKFINELQKKDV